MEQAKLNAFCQQHFDQEPVIVKAAGRINLIGEHTDYNNGFVLPAAIDKGIYMAIVKRNDNKIVLHALDVNDQYQGTLDQLRPTAQQWPDYLLGVVQQLQMAGYTLGGFECAFCGNVPLGAGLSSSAALECATAFALNELFNLEIDRIDMVKLAQAAENQFVGVRCGIMDQFASMFGRKQQLIKLDCGSLDYEYIPFNFDDVSLVLLDTQVKHSLASSEYNTRRAECEAGVALIQKHHSHVRSLRDATADMLDEYVKKHNTTTYNRCLYVVQEIQRLQDACEDLQRNDLDAFGKKLFITHEGLDKLYNVSCPELNWLAEFAGTQSGILGARMMGGGFGGCTINIVKKSAVSAVLEKAAAGYEQQFKTPLKAYVTSIEDGCHTIVNDLVNN